ncbi:MAG TPA: exodeoxyribonuclease I [Xanthomonadaceae bacterium]|nr:exodeoxyribonuclease I [Xanthomonadaceae bacterium]
MDSFLWYDLETFGRDPRRSRIAQFACWRTDTDLHPVDEPLMLYCKPSDDLLPSPGACLITGITPQQARARGIAESEFAGLLNEQLGRPGTCAAGYNSLRFDDEFVRHLLYRNFHDPYAREWRDGNSRWDLLDLARLTFALRPEGIQWPHVDGKPIFKLEALAAANDLDHGHAHDALSDVEALIALARLLKGAQPRLWDYYLGFRRKQRAAALLDVAAMTPVLHVSGRYPAERGCAAIVAPLAQDPQVPNRIIVMDLDPDPEVLLALDADEISDRVFTPTADLPEGESRIPLKQVQLNRCPALVSLDHVRDSELARLGLDRGRSLEHHARLRAAEGLADKVREVFRRPAVATIDPELALYDGFASDADRRLSDRVRATPPEKLADLSIRFQDPRFDELLFRYRARNWPDTLDVDERTRWESYRQRRLRDPDIAEITAERYAADISHLRESGADTAILDALQAWGLELGIEA